MYYPRSDASIIKQGDDLWFHAHKPFQGRAVVEGGMISFVLHMEAVG
jgi:hypothetical protein